MKNTLKKYLVDGLLIVFSVLFALFINKLAESTKINKQKKIAIESIQKELYRNAGIVNDWYPRHKATMEKINDIVEGRNDSLKNEFLKYQFLNLALLTEDESLMDAFLTNTAWETAKTTQVISEFDFETIRSLTFVYDMQEVITEKTMIKILDYYFDREAHNLEQLEPTLIQFQLRFSELVGQEALIQDFYDKAINRLESL
ncbi:MAG: hypothetical protein MK226_17270 [Saprospiraceae bacterium]|nr:hypothetical protein [Saprospiraceae bacterium]